jgi:CHRD domain-containing protein
MLKAGFVAAAFALAACGSSSSGPATHFSATLSSASETPASPHPNPAATGTATYTVNGTTVNYTLTFSGLSGNASAGHIHVGASTEAGGVVVPFTLPAATSGNIQGSFTAADVKAGSTATATITAGDLDSFLAAMRAGYTYTNVHTASNPAGEIRGQNVAQ